MDVDIFLGELQHPLRQRRIGLGFDQANRLGGIFGNKGSHILESKKIKKTKTRELHSRIALTNSIMAPMLAPDSFLYLAMAWLPSKPPSSAAYQ